MNALMIVANGVQDIEAIYPKYRLDEAGVALDVASIDGLDVTGIRGMQIKVDGPFSRASEKDYDLLLLPGGALGIEKLRQEPRIIEFIRTFQGTIGSMCTAAYLLISARIVRGRRIAGYYSAKDDIENAGATFVDAPFVKDGSIVSSPHYRHLGPWMGEVLLRANGGVNITKLSDKEIYGRLDTLP